VALCNTAGLRSLALHEKGFAMATAAPVQPAAPRRGLKALLARHPLVFYFIIAYAGSWLVWMPLLLSERGTALLPFDSPLLAVAFPVGIFMGPFLSGFVMTGATEGRAGVGRLLRRLVLWRVGLRWYLYALLGLPALFLLSVIVLPGGWHRFNVKDSLPWPRWPCSPSSLPYFSSEDRLAKSPAGADLRCPACSGGMVLFSGA
jgi:hypothetical protein